MKVSNYTTEIQIDDGKSMLYNTLSRKYYVYNVEDKEEIWSLLRNLNCGSYTFQEIEWLKIWLEKKIVLQDAIDELSELKVLENTAKYQDSTYNILIYATNACNFRCTYCEQKHVTRVLDEKIMEQILKLVKNAAKKSKKVKIDWFGGEPVIEYKKMFYILEKVNEICSAEGTSVYSTITTNGYLLTDAMLEQMQKLNIKSMQITIDGNRTSHDARRVLANGKGTFVKVMENVNKVLQHDIKVTLRINVDAENIEDISEVLNGIDKKCRSQVFVSISNIFQNKEMLSTYSLLRQAIDMGYKIIGRENSYIHCHACQKNAIVIDTDGSVLLCSNTDSDEKRMGYLDIDGNVRIERLSDYYKLKSISALDNPQCRDCIELPYCIGSCKYSRMKNNQKCLEKRADGLTLKERALLDYYYDLHNITKNKVC